MPTAHVWRQDTGLAAEPRAKLSRRALRWALEGPVVQHLTGARVAEALGWAKDNGYAVCARGRLHRDVIEAYRNTAK